MSRLGAALVSCACALACSAAPLRGGYAQPEAPFAGGRLLVSFIAGHCEDAAHAEYTPRFSSIDLVETETGRPLLLEHRQGHDLLVIENVHDEGSAWVFELIASEDHLSRFRIPRSATGTGSLVVGRKLLEVARGERFQAELASTRLTCSLVPKKASVPVAAM